jgi:hypothetical protein
MTAFLVGRLGREAHGKTLESRGSERSEVVRGRSGANVTFRAETRDE